MHIPPQHKMKLMTGVHELAKLAIGGIATLIVTALTDKGYDSVLARYRSKRPPTA